jgi:hypothetical protein
MMLPSNRAPSRRPFSFPCPVLAWPGLPVCNENPGWWRTLFLLHARLSGSRPKVLLHFLFLLLRHGDGNEWCCSCHAKKEYTCTVQSCAAQQHKRPKPRSKAATRLSGHPRRCACRRYAGCAPSFDIQNDSQVLCKM